MIATRPQWEKVVLSSHDESGLGVRMPEAGTEDMGSWTMAEERGKGFQEYSTPESILGKHSLSSSWSEGNLFMIVLHRLFKQFEGQITLGCSIGGPPSRVATDSSRLR
ncbi:hypothetical protein HPB48_019517 [Haemaphysalis longicornis]|uniref:Uncharacterized protein n=1 Tax=Haemaphysalis longicornis TaxID=44386 RepID=A0A9J6FN63_HAELO|nr:hypothetical protein HPB48_019517 [Haemaphysalis longicornis]